MSALICGSLAYDTITTFPGRFGQQILPDQIHILNVSFLVPTLKREFGGCAGNVAYALHMLGGEPVVMGALGASDGQAYLERLRGWGLATTGVGLMEDTYTAQAIIITDQDNNQITAFHPGAMQHAHEIALPDLNGVRIAIIAPDGREAMMSRAEQLARAGLPFIFDPGQQLPRFDGPELRAFVEKATWLAVNDYEARMLTERTGLTMASLSRLPHLKGLVVTLAHEGCDVWIQGECQRVPGVQAEALVDPTGCGDAFRGGLLWGLEQGWDLVRSAALGNRMGAIKIASAGPQNYRVSKQHLSA